MVSSKERKSVSERTANWSFSYQWCTHVIPVIHARNLQYMSVLSAVLPYNK